MILQFKTLPQLLDFFKEKDKCVEYLEKWRWNGNITCPHCKHEKVYRLKEGYKCANKDCYKKFSVIAGSIFENTKIPLRLWFAVIYLAVSHKKGISSIQLGKDIGVTQKTAWFMLHRIRKMITDIAPEKIDGVVEVDETFVGGKNKNRHKSKKIKYEKTGGRSFQDKTPVIGLLSNGKVRTFVIKDTTIASIRPIIKKNVQVGTIVVTDEWGAYKHLGRRYEHEVVHHNWGRYVNFEGFTTNSIEGFWAILKRGIIGIYHCVSRKHLQKYCEEFTYRYNTRTMTDIEKFETALMKYTGIRLRYKELIA